MLGVVHDAQTYLQDNVSHKLAETPDQITVRVYGSEEPVLREKALEIADPREGRPGVASAVVGAALGGAEPSRLRPISPRRSSMG